MTIRQVESLPETTGLWSIRRKPRHPSIVEVVFGEEGNKAQVAALHTRSSYFRMTCANSAWGTSVVLMPVVWVHGRPGPTQGAPITLTTVTNCGEALCIEFAGKIEGLGVIGEMRILAPSETRIQAFVSITVSGDTPLNEKHVSEAFKLVMLSSMHLSDNFFDTHHAMVGQEAIDIPVANLWIVHPPRRAATFGLVGGTSQWQRGRPAPTVIIDFPKPVAVEGYVAFPDHKANSDHVALWAASPHVSRDWQYQITATVDDTLRNVVTQTKSGGPANRHGPPS